MAQWVISLQHVHATFSCVCTRCDFVSATCLFLHEVGLITDKRSWSLTQWSGYWCALPTNTTSTNTNTLKQYPAETDSITVKEWKTRLIFRTPLMGASRLPHFHKLCHMSFSAQPILVAAMATAYHVHYKSILCWAVCALTAMFGFMLRSLGRNRISLTT